MVEYQAVNGSTNECETPQQMSSARSGFGPREDGEISSAEEHSQAFRVSRKKEGGARISFASKQIYRGSEKEVTP